MGQRKTHIFFSTYHSKKKIVMAPTIINWFPACTNIFRATIDFLHFINLCGFLLIYTLNGIEDFHIKSNQLIPYWFSTLISFLFTSMFWIKIENNEFIDVDNFDERHRTWNICVVNLSLPVNLHTLLLRMLTHFTTHAYGFFFFKYSLSGRKRLKWIKMKEKLSHMETLIMGSTRSHSMSPVFCIFFLT